MGELTLAEGGAAVAFATLALWVIRTFLKLLEDTQRENRELHGIIRSMYKERIEDMAVALSKIGGGDA